MAIAPTEERYAFYRRQIEGILKLVRNGRLRVVVPPQEQLYCQWPRGQFHMEPEIFIQVGGATDFDCPGKKFRLGTRQVCVMPRGVAHAETPVDLRTRYCIMVCCIRPTGLTFIRGESTASGRIMSTWADIVEGTRLRESYRYLDEIATADSIVPGHRRTYIEGLLNAFYITALDGVKISSQEAKEMKSGSSKVVEAEKLIWASLPNSELSVTMISGALRCSADYLSRLFRRERGMTLSQWIIRERVEMARQLLANPRYNISEVGWACGFTSASYFIRVFRKLTGRTPWEFRQLST